MTNHPIPLIQINDPRNPGDYTWVEEASFDPEVHTRFEEGGEEAPKKAPPPPKTEDGPVYTHKIAKNKRWTIYCDGEKFASGIGADNLEKRLEELE